MSVIRATPHRAVRSSSQTSGNTSSTAASAATAAQMKTAKKSAVALGKFFAAAMQKYDAARAKPGATMLKAIKSTFGQTQHTIPPERLMARQSLVPQFFYMTTAIDLRTGAMGQSTNTSGPYWGMLLPPPAARIKGHFSTSQEDTLLNAVQRSFNAERKRLLKHTGQP